MRIGLLVASACLTATAYGCGGGDSTGGGDVFDVSAPEDVTGEDTADTGEDADASVEDVAEVAEDVVEEDVAEVTEDVSETTDDADTVVPGKPRGSPCAESAECESGFCLGSPGVCAVTCDDTNPCENAAHTCLPLADVSVCASRNDIAGLPCSEASDCLAGSTCEAMSDEVSRCVFACGGGCDQGYACDEASQLCIPPGGFDCSLFDAASGRTGRCTDTNVHGTCSGEFSCNGAGAGSCTAPAPAAEVCDNADNDCDTEIDDGLCDDNNACTDDRCDPDNVGACLNEGVSGRECDDGDACSVGDTCNAAGECVGTGSCECETASDCPIPGGRHADCLTVACEGTPKVCVYTNTNAGGTCESSVACLTDGTCDAGGRCEGQAVTCDDGKVCTTDVCNPDGSCSATNLPIGTQCDDGDACTTGDACVAGGLCLSSGSLECTDNDVCTDDSCDPSSGCVFTNNTAPCDDGVDCTINDVCAGGVCGGETLDCSDLDSSCSVGTCTPTGCVRTPVSGSCTDEDPCTLGDECRDGFCVGTPLDCSSLDTACADATCVAGQCVEPTTACTFTARFQLVSAAINYTPNTGAHWLQGSVGHTGPVGPADNGIGFAVYWGFHAGLFQTPAP